MSLLYPLLGAAIAIAGADKVIGDEGYEDMFDDLGWSRNGMYAVGAAEMAGGALMAFGSTRRLGAGIVSAAGLAVLASEVRQGEAKLAGPCFLLTLGALAALLLPHRS